MHNGSLSQPLNRRARSGQHLPVYFTGGSGHLSQLDQETMPGERGHTSLIMPTSDHLPTQPDGSWVPMGNPPQPWYHKYKSMGVDLFILIALIVLYVSLEAAHPRKTYLIKSTLWKHSYPYKENSVPSWTVPVYSILAPVVAFTVAKVFVPNTKLTWNIWYRTAYALLFAIFLTASITNCLKLAIGRPRPNFVFRCWPDGDLKFEDDNEFGGFAVCSTSTATEDEHRKSFPSGHSSWSASGLGFMTFWLLGQTRAFRGGGWSWPLMLSVIPLIASLVVGVSRITDYWHHVSDVCVGLALGWAIALLVYLKLYPFFTNENCDVPTYTHEAFILGEGEPRGGGSANSSFKRKPSANALMRRMKDGKGEEDGEPLEHTPFQSNQQPSSSPYHLDTLAQRGYPGGGTAGGGGPLGPMSVGALG